MITRRTLFALAPLVALDGAPAPSFVRVSPRDRRYLELSDGAPYIPIGLNLIAPPEQAKDGTPGLSVYEKWLDRLAANGGNYVRAWLSNSFWDVEHAKSGEYDEAKAQRIDAMLSDGSPARHSREGDSRTFPQHRRRHPAVGRQAAAPRVQWRPGGIDRRFLRRREKPRPVPEKDRVVRCRVSGTVPKFSAGSCGTR